MRKCLTARNIRHTLSKCPYGGVNLFQLNKCAYPDFFPQKGNTPQGRVKKILAI